MGSVLSAHANTKPAGGLSEADAALALASLAPSLAALPLLSLAVSRLLSPLVAAAAAVLEVAGSAGLEITNERVACSSELNITPSGGSGRIDTSLQLQLASRVKPNSSSHASVAGLC